MDSLSRLLIFKWSDVSLKEERGGQGGELCSMTDQSGEGDYVIHGSAPFL